MYLCNSCNYWKGLPKKKFKYKYPHSCRNHRALVLMSKGLLCNVKFVMFACTAHVAKLKQIGPTRK